jgi:propanediol dehydratase small subunit
MGPQNGVSIFVIGSTVVAMTIVSILYPRPISRYWRRSCAGGPWKRTFPQAPKREIREFLYTFVTAFGFLKHRALQFAPADSVLRIYRGLYPLKGWPDALELETLAVRLEKQYALELRTIWRENLTLGELFSRIHNARTGNRSEGSFQS